MAEEQATKERSRDSRDTTALGTLTSTLRTGDSATPPAKKEKLTALHMLFGPEQLSQDSTLENQLKNYLAEASIPRKEILLHGGNWKVNATRFKILPFVARQLLCMPATSTSAERVFSTAGLTIIKLRTNLKPKNVDALIFLNKNLSKLV